MMNYNKMRPLERFKLLDALAIEFFGTTRWKTSFCERYGLTRQTITAWSNKGAPVWAVQALDDALSTQRFMRATLLFQAAIDATQP
jgi:hypothetical protein